MRGINKVIILGNLGQDPILKPTQNSPMCTISIATSESWLDKKTGNREQRTEWHRVTFFGKLAEIASQYLRKGSKVYIEGSLRTRKWDDNGVTRYATDIVASELQMLDDKYGKPSAADNCSVARQESTSSNELYDDDIPF